MSTRWIYLDESEFELNGQTYIAYGALITENAIAQENINRALGTLKEFRENQDKDYRPKNDDRTLSRGYFHACDDACCAHSAICKEIANLNGEISLNCIPKTDNADLNTLSTTSAISGLHHKGYSALIYEERTGLTNEVVNKLVQNYEAGVIQDYANCLFMPLCFSEPGYKISNKREPGIQFIDFILWAYQRKLNGTPNWYNYVCQNSTISRGIHIKAEYKENQDNKDYFLTTTLNKGLSLPETIGIYNDKRLNPNYLRRNDSEEISIAEIINSLLLINKIMCGVPYNKNPKLFFETQIKEGIEKRKENLEAFLVVFLKMFDTYGFLNITPDIEIKNKMLLARKIAALSFCYNYPEKLKLQNNLQNAWNSLISLHQI